MFERLSLDFVCRDWTSATQGESENKAGAILGEPIIDEATKVLLPTYTSFDDLDIASAFFEQYLLQDARRGANAAEILGGEMALVQFRQILLQNDRRIAAVVCRSADSEANAVGDTFPLRRSEIEATTIQVLLDASLESGNSLSEQMTSPKVLEADLVWFDIQDLSSRHDSQWPASILDEVLELRRSVSAEPSEQPILIVSSLRGLSRTVAPPFVGGCDEGLIHVPLWIDEGDGHARRLQKLAGSFDLLPTLAEYMIAEPAEESSVRPAELEAPNGTKAELQDEWRVAVGTRSLRPVLTGRGCGGDRLLRLVGDGWTALRSQQYLLVSTEPKDEDSGMTSSGLDRRQLYLKPDDFWNVNDSIVTYEAVADEMDAAWREHGI